MHVCVHAHVHVCVYTHVRVHVCDGVAVKQLWAPPALDPTENPGRIHTHVLFRICPLPFITYWWPPPGPQHQDLLPGSSEGGMLRMDTFISAAGHSIAILLT